MSWVTSYFASSIGKKNLMAVTGLLLCGFLVAHLSGNMLLVVGADAFNAYAEALTSNRFLLYTAETILFLIFASHIALATLLTVENRRARPNRYVVKGTRGMSTIASKNMYVTGIIVLVFLVIHLYNFRFADLEGTTLYDVVASYFQNPVWVVYYVLSSCVLGVHVWHGFQSAFKSLGIEHSQYTPFIRRVSWLFAIAVAIGYSFLPIWLHFQGGE